MVSCIDIFRDIFSCETQIMNNLLYGLEAIDFHTVSNYFIIYLQSECI